MDKGVSATADYNHPPKTGTAAYYTTNFWMVLGKDIVLENLPLNVDYTHDYLDQTDPTQAPYGVRTRHSNNTIANLLFADGHVEGKRAKDCLRKLFCMNI